MRTHNIAFKKIFLLTQRQLGPVEKNWQAPKILIEGQEFPRTICDEKLRTVTVRVTQSTLDMANVNQRDFQMIHESVHCLSPRDRSDTVFFEEGLANWYTVNHPRLPERYRADARLNMPPLFVKPYNLFCKLNPSNAKIEGLRKECPALDDVNADLIVKHFKVSESLAKELLERLPHTRPPVM